MNIEAYDAESLRKLVRLLEYENKILKEKLKKENIPYEDVNPFEERMFMPSVERMVAIFRNVIIDGMPDFARNRGAKRHFTTSARILSGHA